MKTKPLIELIQFVADHGGNLEQLSEKGDTLVEAILSRKVKNDREAERLLYGSSEGTVAWRSFKYRLVKILQQRAVGVNPDTSSWTEYTRNRWKCYCCYALATTMLALGRKQSAYECLERAQHIAGEIGLVDMQLKVLYIYRRKAAREGESRVFQQIQASIDELRRARDAEEDAWAVVDKIYMQSAGKTVPRNAVLQFARANLAKLDADRKRFQTYELNTIYFTVAAIVGKLGDDIRFAWRIAEEYREWLGSNTALHRPGDVVRLKIEFAHIWYRTHSTKHGQTVAASAFQEATPGSALWYNAGRYVFLLAMQARDYRSAAEVLSVMCGHPRIKEGGQSRIEELRIYEAALRLVAPEEYRLGGSVIHLTAFSVDHFLRSVPEYRKDKRGYNVSILLIQYLWLLRDLEHDQGGKTYDRLLQVATGLRRYRARHLNLRTRTYRSNCIIGAFEDIADADFRLPDAQSHLERWRSRLQTKTPDYNGTLETMEPIPYDDMIDMALAYMQRQARQPDCRENVYRVAM